MAPSLFHIEALFGLVYLELALCRLTELPPDLAASLPNCRQLILDHNPLTDLTALGAMRRLRRVSCVGCAVVTCENVLRLAGDLPELAVLDVRDNPCTRGFYLPSPVPATPVGADHATWGLTDAPGGDRAASQWVQADQVFVSGMSDRAYVRRTLWRAMATRQRPTLRQLDGLKVTKAQREAAGQLISQARDRGLL